MKTLLNPHLLLLDYFCVRAFSAATHAQTSASSTAAQITANREKGPEDLIGVKTAIQLLPARLRK